MIVIDMQNDFCAKNGWVDHLGVDYTPDRKPIKPLQKLLPVLRQAGVPIIWVNWGNRPDLANMPPNQIHLYKPAGTGIGLGELPPDQRRARPAEGFLGRRRGRRTRAEGRRTSRSTSIASAASGTRRSIRSCATSASAPRCSRASTPTSACCTRLTDANFLGYGCVLVEDCCGTTSPDFCTEATVWNVKKCFGFVTNSGKILKALKKK